MNVLRTGVTTSGKHPPDARPSMTAVTHRVGVCLNSNGAPGRGNAVSKGTLGYRHPEVRPLNSPGGARALNRHRR